jgi:hypothetical protein
VTAPNACGRRGKWEWTDEGLASRGNGDSGGAEVVADVLHAGDRRPLNGERRGSAR